MPISEEYIPDLSNIMHIYPDKKVAYKVFTVVWGKEYKFLTRKVTAMAKAQRYTLEQIEIARKKLRSLPVKTAGKTRAEELLGKDIRKAVRQGYTLHDIRDVLADAGLSVPLTRLKALLEKVPTLEPVTGKEEPETVTALPADADGTGKHGGGI